MFRVLLVAVVVAACIFCLGHTQRVAAANEVSAPAPQAWPWTPKPAPTPVPAVCTPAAYTPVAPLPPACAQTCATCEHSGEAAHRTPPFARIRERVRSRREGWKHSQPVLVVLSRTSPLDR
jgi:hypothetical protein